MPLKKRIFRSNMLILFLALASFMAVAAVVIAVFEDAFFKDFESLESAKLDENIYPVMKIIEQEDGQDWQQINEKLQKYGYEILILKDREILYGDAKKAAAEELLEGFDPSLHRETNGEPEVFYHQKTTAVGKYREDEGVYLMAVHFFEGEWWLLSMRNSFASFLTAFILIGIAVIGVILLLSSLFTKKMVRKITEPLDVLTQGAQRIRSGDLSEEIVYSGDEEFENVCVTFNAMQKKMMEDEKCRIKNEKARIDMVTGISHDLRTPLTAIRGYIKGILDGVADTPKKKEWYLQTAYEATGEMNLLLQKLFDFSRMESGKMPFHMIKVDLAEFSASYAAQKERVTDLKKAEISVIKDTEVLPEIPVDISQIQRVFDNLLENSIKYAGVVPVKIKIYLYEENDGIVLEWSDNGKGVAQEKLDHIFERFYRCDEARTQKGSGVGLYVVKYIIEQHGGTVMAQNTEGLMIRMYFPKGEERQ